MGIGYYSYSLGVRPFRLVGVYVNQPTIVKQMVNRCIIGAGAGVLATVPLGQLWTVRYASICNSDVPALTGSVFLKDSSTGFVAAMVTALSLPVLQRVAELGWWVMRPGDSIAYQLGPGDVMSVQVSGLVWLP